MRKIILPYHLGSGNRGCEGIARGIAKIFQSDSTELIMYDITEYDYQSDVRAGLNEIGELRVRGKTIFELIRWCCRIMRRLGVSFLYNQLMSSYYLYGLNEKDMIFITGGDIYCYKGTYVLPNLIVKKAKKKGIKTVLFGASMEEEYLNDKAVSGVKFYDLIITRETISSANLSKLGLKNYLYPDPAFLLEPEKYSLPDFFKNNDVVGINFSPFTDRNPLFKDNMKLLIKYIVSKGMTVCFIPHVFWKEQDDRTSMKEYTEDIRENVHILDSEKLSYLQIRYAISKCKYFIGGRTHSVISAYCTHTPCIALGYSVKAKGIASDIGMPEYTVVDSKNLHDVEDLLNTFKKLEAGIDEIESVYSKMDDYIKKAEGLKNKVQGSID